MTPYGYSYLQGPSQHKEKKPSSLLAGPVQKVSLGMDSSLKTWNWTAVYQDSLHHLEYLHTH